MRTAIWVAAVLASNVAFADSSLPSAGAHRCTMEDSPYLRQRATLRELAGSDFAGGTKRHALVRIHNDRNVSTVYKLGVEPGSRPTPWFSATGMATGLVERPDGALLGVLVRVGDSLRLIGSMGELDGARPGFDLWTSPPVLGGTNPDSTTARVVGDMLIVTWFHRIATGSRLAAFDLATGKIRWQADVEQLNVDHSKYFNDVDVVVTDVGDQLPAGFVELRGYEAGGCYVQTFDLATGKRVRGFGTSTSATK